MNEYLANQLEYVLLHAISVTKNNEYTYDANFIANRVIEYRPDYYRNPYAWNTEYDLDDGCVNCNDKKVWLCTVNWREHGEETVPLQGFIKPNGTRLLSTFAPFRLIGASAIVYVPTSNISSSTPLSTFASAGSDKMRISALDGDNNEMVTLPSSKMPLEGNENGYKTMLGGAFEGTNPFTSQQVTSDNIKLSVSLRSTAMY